MITERLLQVSLLALAAAAPTFAQEPPRPQPEPVPAPAPAPGGEQARPAEIAPGSGPRLFIADKALEFGRLPHGKTIEFKVPLSNKGDAPLRITRVKPSCGCTVARYPSTLAPGEEGTLDLTFDSGRRAPGKKAYQIRIESNDPTQRDAGAQCTLLTLSGEVIAIFRLAPQAVYFGAVVSGGQPAERAVTVTGVAEELQGGFSVKLDQDLPSYLQTDITPIEGSQPPAVKIRLRLAPDAPRGRIAEELRFRTSSEEHPVFTVRVSAQVMERYSFARPELSLNTLERAVGGETKVALLRRDRGARGEIPVAKLESDADWLELEFLGGSANQKVLSVRVPPGRPPGPFAARVHVLLDDPEQPIASLRVSGWIAPQVEARPAVVLLPTAAPGDGILATVEVRLHPRDAATLATARVEPAGQPISATLQPTEGGARVTLRASGPFAPAELPPDLRLVIESDLPGEERCVVPLVRR